MLSIFKLNVYYMASSKNNYKYPIKMLVGINWEIVCCTLLDSSFEFVFRKLINFHHKDIINSYFMLECYLKWNLW